MIDRRLIRRAVAIAVVLFIVSWASFQLLEWAYRAAMEDEGFDSIDVGFAEFAVTRPSLFPVTLVPFVVSLPAMPLTLWWGPPGDSVALVQLAIGSALWGVVLVAGWGLLERYRQRGRGGRLRA